MNIFTANFPSECGFSSNAAVQRTSNQLAKEVHKYLDAWLGDCIRDFCPEAFELVSKGKDHYWEAMKKIDEQEFSYRIGPDWLVEFYKGETPLRRLKLNVQWTTTAQNFPVDTHHL